MTGQDVAVKPETRNHKGFFIQDNQLVFCVQTYSKVSVIPAFEDVGLLDVTAGC